MNRSVHPLTDTIKMVSLNPLTKRIEEVHPEDGVSILDMAVLFRGPDGYCYSVPGYTAAIVYGEWLTQQRARISTRSENQI